MLKKKTRVIIEIEKERYPTKQSTASKIDYIELFAAFITLLAALIPFLLK